jgi:hypothetical protein
MAKITAILHTGVTAVTSERTERMVRIRGGATVRELEITLHLVPGTATFLIDNRMADAADVLRDGNIVECYPLFSGG